MNNNPFREVLEWFGPNGERWSTKGIGRFNWDTGEQETACSIVALKNAVVALSMFNGQHVAYRLLRVITREMFSDRMTTASTAYRTITASTASVAQFNDHPDTTFDDVRTVFEKAAVRWDERVE